MDPDQTFTLLCFLKKCYLNVGTGSGFRLEKKMGPSRSGSSKYLLRIWIQLANKNPRILTPGIFTARYCLCYGVVFDIFKHRIIAHSREAHHGGKIIIQTTSQIKLAAGPRTQPFFLFYMNSRIQLCRENVIMSKMCLSLWDIFYHCSFYSFYFFIPSYQ